MLSRSISCTNVFRFFVLAVLMITSHWAVADSAELALMPGKVIDGHAKYEEECKNCHKRFDKAAQTGLCLDCHKETAADVRSKKGYHGRLKDNECRTCHTDHKGRDAKIVIFDKDSFKHDETGFILEDKHKTAKCETCHKPKLKYRETPSKCNSCHEKEDVHKGKLGLECGNCHDAKDWKKSSFDHEKSKFKLIGGKHEDVKCDKCHFDSKSLKLDKTFANAPKDCNSCHLKDDKEKGHKGRYGTKCESCHTDRSWKELKFSHDKDTKYVLRDKHIPVKCDACHVPPKPLYKQQLSTKCVACHRKDDKEKGHQGKLGDKCETCHTEKTWKTDDFDHDKNTKYPLKGKHRDAKCDTCHKDGVAGKAGKKVLAKLETKCVSCHRDDDVKKGHDGKYGNKCESCHTEKGWKDITFDHTRDTKYPLKDKHVQVKCKSCHAPEKDLYGQKLATTCISCHRKDDKHKDQLGQKCETCHTEESWTKTKFEHQRMSKYPLLGRHALVTCKKCHEGFTYKDASKECFACHEKDDTHKRTLGTECQTCHSTRSWQAWDFDHGKTKFKLDGPHKKVANKCAECHLKPMGKKVTAPTACGSCHDRDDVHNGSFGDRCERCHDGDDWKKVNMGTVAPLKSGETAPGKAAEKSRKAAVTKHN